MKSGNCSKVGPIGIKRVLFECWGRPSTKETWQASGSKLNRTPAGNQKEKQNNKASGQAFYLLSKEGRNKANNCLRILVAVNWPATEATNWTQRRYQSQCTSKHRAMEQHGNEPKATSKNTAPNKNTDKIKVPETGAVLKKKKLIASEYVDQSKREEGDAVGTWGTRWHEWKDGLFRIAWRQGWRQMLC